MTQAKYTVQEKLVYFLLKQNQRGESRWKLSMNSPTFKVVRNKDSRTNYSTTEYPKTLSNLRKYNIPSSSNSTRKWQPAPRKRKRISSETQVRLRHLLINPKECLLLHQSESRWHTSNQIFLHLYTTAYSRTPSFQKHQTLFFNQFLTYCTIG